MCIRDSFYPSLLNYSFLILGIFLIATSSCKETSATETLASTHTLPLSLSRNWFKDVCPFEEILNYDEVPEKIRSEAEIAMLKFMYPADIDRQIEFQKFRIHKKCEKKEPTGSRSYPYSIHYIRHVDNEVISSVVIRLNFNKDQEYQGHTGFSRNYEKNDDPRYKKYISKTTLDSILKSHNYSDYTRVYANFGNYGHQFASFHKKDHIVVNNKIRSFQNFKAKVNLHTGEFNSRNEWQKETATNFNLIPKYGGGENLSNQLDKHRHFIDSLLHDGQTPRIISEKLIKEGMQFLKDKKRRKAMPLFNLAYLVDSTNANVYWAFGKIKAKAGLKATPWYDIGFSLDSNNVNLIRAYAAVGHRQFNSMKLDRYSTKSDSFYYKTMGQPTFTNTEEWYLKALVLEPDHLRTINNLASLYKNHNRLKEAEEWYLKAFAINQENLNTLENLVDIYLDKNDCKNAIAYHERVKNLPDYCKRVCYISAIKTNCDAS